MHEPTGPGLRAERNSWRVLRNLPPRLFLTHAQIYFLPLALLDYRTRLLDAEDAVWIFIWRRVSTIVVRNMRTMPGLLSALALLLSAGYGFAHEHHTEDIPEGEAVSAEPIVRFFSWRSSCRYTHKIQGRHTMDTHINTNLFLRHRLPHGDGPRSTLPPLRQ